MEVIWAALADRTASDVVDALADRRSRSPRTVKTLLSRLVKKGALAFEADGNRYLYRAKVRREDCVRAESRSFLSRVFAGSAGEMLCRFVDEAQLSAEEIERLRKLLDGKGGAR
jgi:BlaI family transcriptional regulator, penicillinase repressor